MNLFRKTKSGLKKIGHSTRQIILPGFDGLTLYEVTQFFWQGMKNGALTLRASAIAYNFFLAVFPAIIVLFTLIPYIPIDNFQLVLMNFFRDILPENVYIVVESTIQEIVTRKRNDLLSFGFFLSIFFASGGIAALINAFNSSYHNVENRTWVKRQLISLLLVVIFCFLLSIAIMLIIFSGVLIDFFVARNLLTSKFIIALLHNGKWLIILSFTFFSISSLYYLAPARRKEFRFMSPGSILASLSIVITSVGFSAFINNFGQYNKLYGSIGTLIALLIWLFINSLVLLIGFELNASIKTAKRSKTNSDPPVSEGV